MDRAADLQKAVDVTYDAKVQYPAVCNAAETLLVHEAIAPEIFAADCRQVESRRASKFVAARRPSRCCPAKASSPATEEDWSTEYSDLILSIKIVREY